MVRGLWWFRDLHPCRLVNFHKAWLDDCVFGGNVKCEVLVSQLFGLMLKIVFIIEVLKKPGRHVTQSEVGTGIETESVIVKIVNVPRMHV